MQDFASARRSSAVNMEYRPETVNISKRMSLTPGYNISHDHIRTFYIAGANRVSAGSSLAWPKHCWWKNVRKSRNVTALPKYADFAQISPT